MHKKVTNQKREDQSVTKTLFFGICFLLFGISSYSQCAMCRASLESEGNVAKNEALNDGIVYLMAIPYILVAAIGFVVYRMFAKKKSKETES